MYSIRMRANKDDKHISGAEMLVTEGQITGSAVRLLERALHHEKGKPGSVNISIEALKGQVNNVTSLPVTFLSSKDVEEGRNTASKILKCHGIPEGCIKKAFSLIAPSNGENMRGAILMDMKGRRLEPDERRGIRASRMGITEKASLELFNSLSTKGLSDCYTKVKEALVLATKVSSVRGTIAELCWSDDPSYTTGYVASKKYGYMRVPNLKPEGDSSGGRVFFVNDINPVDYINEIEKSPVLINRFGGIKDSSEIYNITGG